MSCMQALYGSVHLFFLSSVPDAVMDSLRGCPELLKRIKSFKEINLDFIVAEAETYHLHLGLTRKSAYIVILLYCYSVSDTAIFMWIYCYSTVALLRISYDVSKCRLCWCKRW
jgi:hypothetical protein